MSQQVKTKISPRCEDWHHLCSLLHTLGVELKNDKLLLSWDRPDTPQFEFLLNLLGKFSTSVLIGEYKEKIHSWEIHT